MALFGTATPVSKLVGDAFPAFLASGLRMATAAAVLLPVLLLAHEADPRALVSRLDRADRLRVLAIALVGTFGFTLFLFYGLTLVSGAVGAVVMATTPAVTAVGAVLFLRGRADRLLVGAIGLAVVGVAVVNLGTGGDGGNGGWLELWLGSLLVFGAVCAEATYTLVGKRLAADLSPVAIAALAAVGAGLAFAPVAVAQAVGFDWSTPTWTDWAAVVWWGAATMGLGSVLWFRGMQGVAGTTASGFMAVMPVSALVGSYVLLDEGFSWWHAAGMAAVLAALAAVVYRDSRS